QGLCRDSSLARERHLFRWPIRPGRSGLAAPLSTACRQSKHQGIDQRRNDVGSRRRHCAIGQGAPCSDYKGRLPNPRCAADKSVSTPCSGTGILPMVSDPSVIRFWIISPFPPSELAFQTGFTISSSDPDYISPDRGAVLKCCTSAAAALAR